MHLFNRKADFDYILTGDKIEAGIVLSGWETKSLFANRADLSAAQIRFVKGELFLYDCQLLSDEPKAVANQPRKLLLKKAEILALATKVKAKGLTLVPYQFYTMGHLIKLEIRLGKAKRKFQKKRGRLEFDG